MYKESSLSKKLLTMSEMEKKHAGVWLNFLKKRSVDIRSLKINKLKVDFLALIFRVLGLGLTLRLLELGERSAIDLYSTILESAKLTDEEKEAIKQILEDELVHEHDFLEEETKFRDFINHVRDAVLGMSDGLVEVLSVSAGLAGAYGNPIPVAMGGAIVGIAGALSMSIGTYTSVKAQKQVRLSVISRVKLASKYVAHVFTSRVINYMRKKGLSSRLSKSIANEALRNSELLSKIVTDEEYGLKEEILENPAKAGLYTGAFYIIGALVPLTPYFLSIPVSIALPWSFMLAALMLAVTGFIIAVSANLEIKRKILELIIAGLGSATITFIIGKIASLILGIEIS